MLREIVKKYRRKRKVGRIELFLPGMREGEGAFAAAIFSGRNLRYHIINHSVIDLWEQGFYTGSDYVEVIFLASLST